MKFGRQKPVIEMTLQKALKIKHLAKKYTNLKDFDKEARLVFPDDYNKPVGAGLLFHSWMLLQHSQKEAGWKCSYARYRTELVMTRKIARQIHYIRVYENRGNFTGIARRLQELHPFHHVSAWSQDLISGSNDMLGSLVNNSELYYRNRLEPVMTKEIAEFIIANKDCSSRRLSEILTDKYSKYDFGDGMQVGHYYLQDAYRFLGLQDPED